MKLKAIIIYLFCAANAIAVVPAAAGSPHAANTLVAAEDGENLKRPHSSDKRSAHAISPDTDTCDAQSGFRVAAALKPVAGLSLGWKRATHGIGLGAREALAGMKAGSREAYLGLSLGSKHAARGIGIGSREALSGFSLGGEYAAYGLGIGGSEALAGISLGSEHTAHGLSLGTESTVFSIGKAAYNESAMFYNPSRKLEEMDNLSFEETAIDVEDGITIYTYHFRSDSAKANIFLVHGNGGNVSTYKNMIRTLIDGRYNVYVVDWRGYGKSTGKPDYRGVMKDTGVAFDHFLSRIRPDSLKVMVYGMSLGGQIATKLVRDRQHQVDALVLDGSLSSAQNLVLDFMPTAYLRDGMKKRSALFNQDYVAERDIKEIANLPKLIIHSAVDRIVLPYHGKLLYENALPPKSHWQTATSHIGTLEELPIEAILRLDTLIDYSAP